MACSLKGKEEEESSLLINSGRKKELTVAMTVSLRLCREGALPFAEARPMSKMAWDPRLEVKMMIVFLKDT